MARGGFYNGFAYGMLFVSVFFAISILLGLVSGTMNSLVGFSLDSARTAASLGGALVVSALMFVRREKRVPTRTESWIFSLIAVVVLTALIALIIVLVFPNMLRVRDWANYISPVMLIPPMIFLATCVVVLRYAFWFFIRLQFRAIDRYEAKKNEKLADRF